MEEINTLSLKIDQLERDRRVFVEFGSGCFIGIFGTGIMIDHHYYPILWLVLFALIGSLIAAIVIGVKKGLEKDQYIEDLRQLQSNSSPEGA